MQVISGCNFFTAAPLNDAFLVFSPFPCTLRALLKVSHHPRLFSCIVVPKQATLTLSHFPGGGGGGHECCRIYFMGARQAGTLLAVAVPVPAIEKNAPSPAS